MDEMEGIKETDETEILAEERGQHESNLTSSDRPVHLQSCLNRGRITGLVLSPLTSPSHWPCAVLTFWLYLIATAFLCLFAL